MDTKWKEQTNAAMISFSTYKTEHASSEEYTSPFTISMPCGWNESTKTGTEPERSSKQQLNTKLTSLDAVLFKSIDRAVNL